MQRSANVFLVIEQGSVFNLTVTWLDENNIAINCADYILRMQVRETYDSDTILLDLTEANGGIINKGYEGFSIFLTSTQTAALEFDTAVYDVEAKPKEGDGTYAADDLIRRVMHGAITLSKEVTKQNLT